MMGVWSYLRQFMYTKWVIVVDEDIDARDWKDVMWAISTRMDPARDITLIENTPIDYLDFASPRERPGLQDRPRRHQQVAAGDHADLGNTDPHGPRGGGRRLGQVGEPRTARRRSQRVRAGQRRRRRLITPPFLEAVLPPGSKHVPASLPPAPFRPLAAPTARRRAGASRAGRHPTPRTLPTKR